MAKLNEGIYLNPSQDSSVGSISAWYRGGSGFKSRQGREFFNENNQVCESSRGGLVRKKTERSITIEYMKAWYKCSVSLRYVILVKLGFTDKGL